LSRFIEAPQAGKVALVVHSNDKNTSSIMSAYVAVLVDLDLDSSSPPADAMQNFCDSRFYPTARLPIESSR
jgi:hypothetical protein